MDLNQLYPIAMALVILAFTATLAFIVKNILYRLQNHQLLPEWLRTLSHSFYKPSLWIISGYGILYAAKTMTSMANFPISSEILSISKNLFFTVSATWVFLSWKSDYEKVLKNRIEHTLMHGMDEALLNMVSRLVSIAVFIVVGLIILDIFDVQLTAILAFGGIGGAAIAFASKDMIANFFGGLMVHINRQIAVGERIRSPNKNFEGVVEDIGWYVTRIRTLERRPTYIPNALFIDAIIENIGRIDGRRIEQAIGIRYQDIDKIEAIVDSIRRYIQKMPEIDQEKLQLVHFTNFSSSSLDIEMVCYTKSIEVKEWRDVQQKLFLGIAKIIADNGSQMAYPTQTVIVEMEKS